MDKQLKSRSQPALVIACIFEGLLEYSWYNRKLMKVFTGGVHLWGHKAEFLNR